MNDLLAQVAGYYDGKLREHGATARGVDWNGSESQFLRFEQLARVIDTDQPFSLHDVGCGYGALLDFLQGRHSAFRYIGWDVSAEMVAAARERYSTLPHARFEQGDRPDAPADYAVASGIFNVRFDRSDEEWRAYVLDTLRELDRASLRGFAFNCLTSYSDADRMRPDLFYADPCALFDFCKRQFSRQVALLHDYGLYEFTIVVRK